MTFEGGVDNWGTLFNIKKDGTGFTKLIDFGGTTTGMNPWGSLISDGTYVYGLTGGGGTNAFSGVLFKYKMATLSSPKNEFAQNFNLYPNPSNGTFTIEIDQNLMGAKTTIFNLLGQKIKDFELKTTTTHQNLRILS
jgi:hypothetical protein